MTDIELCVDNFFWLYNDPLLTLHYLKKNFYCFTKTFQFFQEQSKQCKVLIWDFQFHWQKLFTPCIFQSICAFVSLFFFSFFPIFPCAVQNAFYQPSSLSCQSLLSRQAYKTMSGNDHKSFLTFWIIFLNHLDHLHFVQKLHFYLPVVNVLIPFYIGWLSDNLLLYPCTPPLDWSVFISKISPNASYRWKYYHFQMKPWDRYRFSLLLKQRKHRNVKKTNSQNKTITEQACK